MNMQQAREYIANQSHDQAPIASLNRAGIEAVNQFVNKWHKRAPFVNYEAFYSDAELEAYNMVGGETGILEIPARHSVSGNPITLRLEPEYFDFSI